MSEFKSKQIFEDSPEINKSDEELTAQLQFEQEKKFVPAEAASSDEAELEAENNLEKVIRPKKRSGWLMTGLVTSFAGLLGWQAVDTVVTAVQTADWLTVGWSALATTVAGLGVGAIGKELWKLRKLRNHFSVQEQSEALLKSDSVGKGRAFCESLATEAGIPSENPHFDRWRNSINQSHNDAELLEMYDAMVIKQQDTEAKKLVARLSSEAAVLVAVSPLAIADILLVAWRNFKLIDQLGEIYGVELGYWSRIKLFKLVLVNMAAAGASELAVDTSMDLLSMDLAGKVSTRVAQGFGVGILTARLGIKAMSLLRPIPWKQEDKVRLGEIRRELIYKLKDKI
ncbi:TIGR01620 family protein [Vibrio hannami]|uniref:YcjF family protein n=1 Tax=Vibrio hannami TaxID=2717094 RepID=UPI00240FA25D|nr:TIGR01620 family protein [Vibrio hannami]MDG3088193.1 TIGR01620 family protein [Vibrio hannami]